MMIIAILESADARLYLGDTLVVRPTLAAGAPPLLSAVTPPGSPRGGHARHTMSGGLPVWNDDQKDENGNGA